MLIWSGPMCLKDVEVGLHACCCLPSGECREDQGIQGVALSGFQCGRGTYTERGL